jgi:hypothetical protein
VGSDETQLAHAEGAASLILILSRLLRVGSMGASELTSSIKYGCPNHRYRGICTKNVWIRYDRLESYSSRGYQGVCSALTATDFTLKHLQIKLRCELRLAHSSLLPYQCVSLPLVQNLPRTPYLANGFSLKSSVLR